MKKVGPWTSVATAYLCLLLYGYHLDRTAESLHVYWPAAGLLLASLVASKFRHWPIIIGFAFGLDELARFLQEPDFQLQWRDIEYFFSNEVGTTVAALVLRLWSGANARWISLVGFLRILVAGAVVGATISATVGTFSLSPSDPELQIFLRWRLWWLGETLGILTVGTLSLWSRELFRTHSVTGTKLKRDWSNVAGLVAYIGLVGLLFNGTRGLAQPFLLYPPLIWIAVRLGPWYTSTVLTSTIILAVGQTTRGIGPFVHLGSDGSSATAVQLYSLALALSSLSLSTNLTDRRRSVLRKEVVLGKLGDSELRYETLFEHAGVPILVVNETGVERANPAACKLWECEAKDMLVPLSNLSAEVQSSGEEFAELWPHQFWDGAIVPWTASTSKGKLLELDLHVSKVKLPSGTHFQLVVRDKTARIELENRLEKERQRLDFAVSAATAVLEETRLRLEQANLQRQRFMATISHELRTPLTAILGRSETLLEGLYGPLQDEQISAISRINESGQFLEELVRDLLDLAKVESLDVPTEVSLYDLKQLSESCIRLVKTMAEKKGVEIIPPESLQQEIELDSRFFKQILVNLLTNAIKFTPKGGKSGVRLFREDEQILLEVWDTGSGMTEELQTKLFQPFVREDETVPGFGLGLALVQRLCRAMGGEIQVQSELGQGTTFRVRLPIKSEASKNKNSPEQITFVMRESDDAEWRAMPRYLQNRGHRVLRGDTFEDVRSQLSQHLQCIILLDSESDSVDFLSTLERESSERMVVVIADRYDTDLKNKLLSAGATLVVLKPTPLPDLENHCLELWKRRSRGT